MLYRRLERSGWRALPIATPGGREAEAPRATAPWWIAVELSPGQWYGLAPGRSVRLSDGARALRRAVGLYVHEPGGGVHSTPWQFRFFSESGGGVHSPPAWCSLHELFCARCEVEFGTALRRAHHRREKPKRILVAGRSFRIQSRWYLEGWGGRGGRGSTLVRSPTPSHPICSFLVAFCRML